MTDDDVAGGPSLAIPKSTSYQILTGSKGKDDIVLSGDTRLYAYRRYE